MKPAEWRRFARQPGGIATILLLALLLAFRVQACPMLSNADFVLPDTFSNDCHQLAVEDAPSTINPLDCHDGPCLQALGDQGGFDLHQLPSSGADWLASTTTSTLLPPDWSGRHDFPPSIAPATGPPPPQRSRVLRL